MPEQVDYGSLVELPDNFDHLTLRECNEFRAQAKILVTSTCPDVKTLLAVAIIITMLDARIAEIEAHA